MIDINFNLDTNANIDEIYVAKDKTNNKVVLAFVTGFQVGSYPDGVIYLENDMIMAYSSRKYFEERFTIIRKVKSLDVH